MSDTAWGWNCSVCGTSRLATSGPAAQRDMYEHYRLEHPKHLDEIKPLGSCPCNEDPAYHVREAP